MSVGNFGYSIPANMRSAKAYMVGDLHVGSPDLNSVKLKRIINEIIMTP